MLTYFSPNGILLRHDEKPRDDMTPYNLHQHHPKEGESPRVIPKIRLYKRQPNQTAVVEKKASALSIDTPVSGESAFCFNSRGEKSNPAGQSISDDMRQSGMR